MGQVWFVAALWLLLALVAVLAANWLRISTALSEIVVGTAAQLVIGALVGGSALGAKADWITFLAGTGAIVLTFLAGAELDPEVFRAKWKESSAVGLIGFFAPFVGATLVAHYVLGWGWRPSWLAGGSTDYWVRRFVGDFPCLHFGILVVCFWPRCSS
jgi:glutathione-regulated potassium-efflux system ancillary protein KefC